MERDDALRTAARDAFFAELFADALRFGGCVIVRRLIGFAHNADFERIEDPVRRAPCELRALSLGRELLVNCRRFADVGALLEAARDHGDAPLPYGALGGAGGDA